MLHVGCQPWQWRRIRRLKWCSRGGRPEPAPEARERRRREIERAIAARRKKEAPPPLRQVQGRVVDARRVVERRA